MGKRFIVFDLDSIKNLLIHYGDGCIPLSAEVKELQVSNKLPRWLNLLIDCDSWEGTPFETGKGYNGVQPLMFRYEGKRTMVLQHLKDPISWSDENSIEAPRFQG